MASTSRILFYTQRGFVLPLSQTLLNPHFTRNLLISQSACLNWMCGLQRRQFVRFSSNALVTLNTDDKFARFSLTKTSSNRKLEVEMKGAPKSKKPKMSKREKVNQLKWYRLKAKKQMKSNNPEVRIRYKLEKAKRKEEWLIEKLRKFDMPKGPEPVHDPEILTEEERFYLRRTGEKKKHYVPVGRRGVFGGVVLNMHLHWKNHETVKVVCKPCRPGQVHEYAAELARLSKGTVLGMKGHNIIIFYRGKNYVQPDVMSPTDTLSKNKVEHVSRSSFRHSKNRPGCLADLTAFLFSPRWFQLGKCLGSQDMKTVQFMYNIMVSAWHFI